MERKGKEKRREYKGKKMKRKGEKGREKRKDHNSNLRPFSHCIITLPSYDKATMTTTNDMTREIRGKNGPKYQLM